MRRLLALTSVAVLTLTLAVPAGAAKPPKDPPPPPPLCPVVDVGSFEVTAATMCMWGGSSGAAYTFTATVETGRIGGLVIFLRDEAPGDLCAARATEKRWLEAGESISLVVHLPVDGDCVDDEFDDYPNGGPDYVFTLAASRAQGDPTVRVTISSP